MPEIPDTTKGCFNYNTAYDFDAGVGLNEATVRYISDVKQEPDWIREFRLKALQTFYRKELPSWVPKEVSTLDLSKIRYYLSKGQTPAKSWDHVHADVKETFQRLGIPQQEKQFLAGVEAQFDSEFAYSKMCEKLQALGVVFTDSTQGLIKYPEIFKKYFATVIPPGDNTFSALNSAVFSGGSFIYIPPGVKVQQPLQAYFRINAENFGQFERTLIIADEGSEVLYLEGCTAPKFSSQTLHSGVVELVALKDAKIQYVTVQNWAHNVFNLVTKRGIVHENAQIRWIDCNIGSQITLKYPALLLKGQRAKGEVLSISLANTGQIQDTGAKMIHLADETTSTITAKSITLNSGDNRYRSLVAIPKNLKKCHNFTQCHSLLLHPNNATATMPTISVTGNQNSVQHEASVSKIHEEQLFYMRQRGLSEYEAMSLSVNGFVNELIAEFPLEYSVELKRLIEIEMKQATG